MVYVSMPAMVYVLFTQGIQWDGGDICHEGEARETKHNEFDQMSYSLPAIVLDSNDFCLGRHNFEVG